MKARSIFRIGKLEKSLTEAAELLRIDWELTFTCGHECAWSGQLRITAQPNDGLPRRSVFTKYNIAKKVPDESKVFYITGGSGPNHCAQMLMPSCLRYIDTLKNKHGKAA